MTTATRRRNRIAPPPATPAPAPVSLPTSSLGKQAAYADAVLAAVLTLQAQLADPDPAAARAAAGMILDLEKTRMRHGQPVAGTGLLESVPLAPRVVGSEPLAERVEHESGEEPADQLDEEFVDEMQAKLEELKGTNGIPEVITRRFAEDVARHARPMLEQAGIPPNPRVAGGACHRHPVIPTVPSLG